MSSACQKSVVRFVSPNVPTCLPQHLLRNIVKQFQAVAPEDRKLEFRPYSKQGGADYDHNHRTKKGLFETVHDTLDHLPNKLWTHPEVAPNNPYLQALHDSKIPFSNNTFVETMNDRYLKPFLLRPFNTIWLSANDISAAINNASRNRNFKFVGVFRPVPQDTAYLINEIKAVYNKKRRQSPYYKFYGIVWNTDANGGGNHWVAALFSPYKKTYEFFDSFGHAASGAVLQQLNTVKSEIAKISKFPTNSWTELFVGTQHQTQGHQCGVYTIWFFLQRMVHKKSYATIQSQAVNDAAMIKVRKEHFIPADPRIIRLHEDFERKNASKRENFRNIPKEEAIPLLSDSDEDEEDREQKYRQRVRDRKYREGVSRYKQRLNRQQEAKRQQVRDEKYREGVSRYKQRLNRQQEEKISRAQSKRDDEKVSRYKSPASTRDDEKISRASREEQSKDEDEKQRVSKPLRNRAFPSQVSRVERKQEDSPLVKVDLLWTSVVNETLKRYSNSEIKVRLAKAFIWFKWVFLQQFCEKNYEMPQETLTHFISCAMSLLYSHITRYNMKLDLYDQYFIVAAGMLAFKALGIDDSQGCYNTLNLNYIVQYTSGYRTARNQVDYTNRVKATIQDAERRMYALSKNSPCLEEFQRAYKRLGIARNYEFQNVAVPLPKPSFRRKTVSSRRRGISRPISSKTRSASRANGQPHE